MEPFQGFGFSSVQSAGLPRNPLCAGSMRKTFKDVYSCHLYRAVTYEGGVAHIGHPELRIIRASTTIRKPLTYLGKPLVRALRTELEILLKFVISHG